MVATTGEMIDVEYSNKTWSDQKDQVIITGDLSDPVAIRAQIASGHWTVLGPAELDGHRAIELTWRITHDGTVLATAHLWVDAQTYLPLREEASYLTGRPGRDDTGTNRTDYELRPATAANLAQLRPDIPAGFRQTVSPEPPSHGPTGVAG
jgi:hypothetical protein